MPLDMTGVDASIAGLTAEVIATETQDASLVLVLQAQAGQTASAVAAALAAEGVTDAATLAAVQSSIDAITARFVAAAAPLASAIPANTPPTTNLR